MVASMSRMYLNKFDPTKGIETQKSLIVPPLLVTFDLNKFDPIKGIETFPVFSSLSWLTPRI